MNTMEVGRRTPLGSAIARRAIDLALDDRLSFEDGAQHLCRLANGERAPLDAALRDLPCAADAGPAEECARLLLRRAVGVLTSA
jgi:hypothetical protein